MSGLPGWAGVEARVGDRRRTPQRSHQPAGERLQQPSHRRARTAVIAQQGRKVGQRFGDGTRLGGKQLLRPRHRGTPQTRALEVLLARRATGYAHVVSCDTRARSANFRLAFGSADQHPDLGAGSANTGISDDPSVARSADRAERPRRGVLRPLLMAQDTCGLPGLVAAVAEVGLSVLAACGNPALLSACSAGSDWCLVATLAEVITIDDSGDVIQAGAACALSPRPGAVSAKGRAIFAACAGRPEPPAS